MLDKSCEHQNSVLSLLLKRSEYFIGESKTDDCRFFVNNKCKLKQFLFRMLAEQETYCPPLVLVFQC